MVLPTTKGKNVYNAWTAMQKIIEYEIQDPVSL